MGPCRTSVTACEAITLTSLPRGNIHTECEILTVTSESMRVPRGNGIQSPAPEVTGKNGRICRACGTRRPTLAATAGETNRRVVAVAAAMETCKACGMKRGNPAAEDPSHAACIGNGKLVENYKQLPKSLTWKP